MSTESIKDLREEFDDGAMEPHLIRLLDRLEAAEARVAELEAAQQPRPMAEAPQDGTHILIKCEFGWSVGHRRPRQPTVWYLTGWHATEWRDDLCLGWLPLPDREEGK